jgi:hypothetical protein
MLRFGPMRSSQKFNTFTADQISSWTAAPP